MSVTERVFRLLVAVGLVVGFLPVRAAEASIIYTFDGGATHDNYVWTTAANWDNEGTAPPGSLINGDGATDDIVIIDTTYIAGGKTILLSGTDAGTIDSLVVGGGNGNVTLKLQNDGAGLVITNDVTLGGVDPADGTTQRIGNLAIGNDKNVTMTINGNIVSGGTADNDVTLNTKQTVTLAGDIDPGGAHEIDLHINRGTLTWNGTVMNVEEFDVVDIGGANVTNTWTIGTGQTVTASARADVGRNSSGASNNDKTTNGTLNIYGGSFISTSTGESLVIGNVSSDVNTATKHHTATGTVNVGNPAEPLQVSTMTLAGELKVGPNQNNSASGNGDQIATGIVNVHNPGSTVTINGGVEMAANGVDTTGSSTATLNIYDGLVTIYKHIEDAAAAQNQSTINLEGGRLHLATPTLVTAPNAANAPRAVDTFKMKDGATLQMTLSDQALPLTVNTTLDLEDGGDTGGNALIDLDIASDVIADPTDVVEWDGGAGTGQWDANATNWAPDVLPSQAADPIVNGVNYVIIDGTTATAAPLNNLANAALVPADAGTWALDIVTNPQQLQATRTGPTLGCGPAKATLSDAGDVVTRTTDLKVGEVVGHTFDAAALEIHDGSLTVQTNLLIEGDNTTEPADQEVLVAGGALTVDGDLEFGTEPGVGTGGTFRQTGGTTHVKGQITTSGSGAAQVFIDGGTLTVDGNLTCKTFRTGHEAGKTGTYTVPSGQTLLTSGYLVSGNNGTGALTISNGAVVQTDGQFRIGAGATGDGTVIMNGGTLTVTDDITAVGISGKGLLEIKAGTATFGNEVKAGDGGTGDGTIKVGEGGGNPTVTVSGGNTEIPEDGTGAFELYSGTWYHEDNNFVQGQSDGAVSTVTIHSGTIDLTGTAGTHTGQWNVNKGTHTTDILGGLIRMGSSMQLTNSAASRVIITIGDDSGANPTVLVGINNNAGINYRNNGTDTINLRSGTLDLTGGVIDADTTGTNAFNWTGGVLKDVKEFQGNLAQDNTDSDSLLVIGNSPGTMTVTGNYTLNGGNIDMELLVDPATGVKGTDWDLLDVTGTAAFNRDGQIALDLGTYAAQLNDSWDIVDAAAITTDYATIGDLFDVTNAALGTDLTWDFSQFTTDGTVTVTPEPATMTLLGIGLAGAALLRRRRRG